MNDSIIINLTNDEIALWKPEMWDDYSYEGSVFVVKKFGEWKGIYNMNFVQSVEVIEVTEDWINENC